MNRNTRPRAAGTDISADPKRRRGSTYILILGVAATATIIGLASVAVSRVNARGVTRSNDWAEAQVLAFSAVEHALNRIDGSRDWRAEFDGNVMNTTFGHGTFRWRVVDETDGNLTDYWADEAVVIATGLVGDASYSVSVLLKMATSPLQTCITVGGQIKVGDANVLTATGSPIHVNGAFDSNGIVNGDVEAASLIRAGTITGTLTVPVDSLQMPDANVFAMYKALATTIPTSSTLENLVISPQTAPGGVTNADGVYYMNTNDLDLTIKKVRIHGTLVIESGDGRVRIEDSVFMQSYRADYPVLIVSGRELKLMYKSDSNNLSESDANTNFNPPGSPYEGQSDSDMADEYPNEIRGLVHAMKDITVAFTARVRGIIIVKNKMECKGTNEVIYDPTLYDNPPIGYASHKVIPGAWKRVFE